MPVAHGGVVRWQHRTSGAFGLRAERTCCWEPYGTTERLREWSGLGGITGGGNSATCCNVAAYPAVLAEGNTFTAKYPVDCYEARSLGVVF